MGAQKLHVAHTALLLLRMLQAYMTFQEAVPFLIADTARRAVDLLKVSPLASPSVAADGAQQTEKQQFVQETACICDVLVVLHGMHNTVTQVQFQKMDRRR